MTTFEVKLPDGLPERAVLQMPPSCGPDCLACRHEAEITYHQNRIQREILRGPDAEDRP